MRQTISACTISILLGKLVSACSTLNAFAATPPPRLNISALPASPDHTRTTVRAINGRRLVVESLSQRSFGFIADEQGIAPLPEGASGLDDLGQLGGGVEVGPDQQAFAAELVDRVWVALPGDRSRAISVREQLGEAGDRWTRLCPRDINNNRTIVGDGYFADGRWSAWVASPIPEPAMIGVLALLGILSGRVR